MRAIVDPARCQICSGDVFRRLVNAQMQLSPDTALPFARAVLTHGPLARAEYLQSGGVDHDMTLVVVPSERN